MLYCYSTLVFTDYFIINNANIQKNNNYKVKEQPSKTNVRSHFFTNRDTGLQLTFRGDTAPRFSPFKSRLKQFDFNKFLIVK